MQRFTLKELHKLETKGQGHTDNLKFDLGGTRVWLSRMTIADGMPYNNQVTVESLDFSTYTWKTVDVYKAS